jgi:small subunit ribosomal protein S17
MAPKTRGLRKTREGIVVSDRMDKTVAVRVERLVRHPRYGRVVRRWKKYLAHDADNRCRVGDWVRIVECRPLSKRKSWRVAAILRRGVGEEMLKEPEEGEITEGAAATASPAASAPAEQPASTEESQQQT